MIKLSSSSSISSILVVIWAILCVCMSQIRIYRVLIIRLGGHFFVPSYLECSSLIAVNTIAEWVERAPEINRMTLSHHNGSVIWLHLQRLLNSSWPKCQLRLLSLLLATQPWYIFLFLWRLAIAFTSFSSIHEHWKILSNRLLLRLLLSDLAQYPYIAGSGGVLSLVLKLSLIRWATPWAPSSLVVRVWSLISPVTFLDLLVCTLLLPPISLFIS